LTSVTASGAVSAVDYAQVGFLTTDSAEGFVGTVGPVISVALSGVQAAGSVGTVIAIYWKLIDDSQDANWQNITDSQTPGWATINSSQTTSWQNVETSQTPGWTDIQNTENADWELIDTTP
jgi:hypothetical protein